jgi:hypothetical protein
MQITFKDKARADEKAQHTWEYVSILKSLATPYQSALTHIQWFEVCLFQHT